MSVVLERNATNQFWGKNGAWTAVKKDVLAFDSVPDAADYALSQHILDARVAVVDLEKTAATPLPSDSSPS